MKNYMLDGIMGLVVGDALGLPVSFTTRESLEANPVTGMREYGTYTMPRGTWSDDSSLTLATLDSLRRSQLAGPAGAAYDLSDIAGKFTEWYQNGKYTPYGETFDMGKTCTSAIERFIKSGDPRACGMVDERSNGNGSLMRIFPACIYGAAYMDDAHALQMVDEIGAITHAHPVSRIACGIYYYIAKHIAGIWHQSGVACVSQGAEPLRGAIREAIADAFAYYEKQCETGPDAETLARFERLKTIETLDINQIKSTGYVVDTLEAAVWCLLTTGSYQEAVLRAVNLGDDADTVAAVTGGIAGLYYGIGSIPQEWRSTIPRREWIENLCEMKGELIREAVIYAACAHMGQVRKGTAIPYISHPLEVMQILREMKTREALQVAGVLHDTVEDTSATSEEIERLFSQEVGDLVATHTEDKSLSWEERKTRTIENLAGAPRDVKLLLFADTLSNLRSIAKDVCVLGDELWSRFRRGKDAQGWYYGAKLKIIKDMEEKTPEIQAKIDEARELYEEVFGKL